jgi:hypothetical protein
VTRTPEDHIKLAEKYLYAVEGKSNLDGATLGGLANMALAHIELARWKEKH